MNHSKKLGLALLAAIVIALLATVWSGLDDPLPPPGGEPRATATHARTGADAPWGHDELTASAPATARPRFEPGLPASATGLSTQRPFVPAPARTAPPSLVEASTVIPPDPRAPAR